MNFLNRFNLMRVLRLAIGIIGAGQAYITHDWLLGIAGAFLITMAVFNIGCCGIGGCQLPVKKKHIQGSDPVDFEEVK